MKAILIAFTILLINISIYAEEAMIVAHRGASQDAPENTMPAFKLAWEQGADAIEGDFHLTKDSYIVCIHDDNTLQVRALKTPDKSHDFHDYPHIIQSADGVLHVFYSRHNRSLFQLTAPSPNTIDGEWTARELGSRLRATYPMPISDSKGTMYVFYRVTKGRDYRPMAYVKSSDNGKTWSKPIKAIDHEKTRREDHLDEIYIGAFTPASPKDLGEVFQCTWTLAGGGPERHDHDDYHMNVYHAYFRPSDGHWLSADGTDLGSLIDDTVAEKHCKVFDSGALYGMERPVNKHLNKIPKEVENTACAKSDGLQAYDGNTHFNTQGQLELGKRYATEMLKIRNKQRVEQ